MNWVAFWITFVAIEISVAITLSAIAQYAERKP
jgi:hypothetical protein